MKKMPHAYCKVRNCDQFGNRDCKLVYQLPNFKANRPLTLSQEVKLKRRRAWLKALGYNEDDSSCHLDDLVVCAKHFVSGKPAPIGQVNDVDWIPTLHLGLDDNAGSDNSDVVDLTLDSEDEEVEGSCFEFKALKRKVSSVSAQDTSVTSKLPRGIAEGMTATTKWLKNHVHNNAVEEKLPRLKPSPKLHEGIVRDRTGRHPVDKHASLKIESQEQSECINSEQSPSTEELDCQYSKDVINKLKTENQQLLSQNLNLKAKLLEIETLYKSLEADHRISMSKFFDLQYAVNRYTINEKTFTADEEKVRYLTGLPTYDVLKAMFVHIEPYIETSQYATTKFQQYILTLMCIRLNICFDLLSYIFRLPLHSVTQIFYQVLQVMYVRYKPLVSWPMRENLFPTVPLLFRETFGQHIVVIVDILELSVVIDSIEVLMDGPSENCLSALSVISDYRNHTYVKFLIGLSPQGAVTFISKSFRGNLSEKELIESSGLMQNLYLGDIILGGNGCSVHEIAKQKANSEDNKLSRLQPYHFKNGQNISCLKVHVERVVDIFNKSFKFWSSGLPVDFFNVSNDGPPAIDMMIQACCALNNASLTVVL